MKENDAYQAGFVDGADKGRVQGWKDHSRYLVERQEAYGRSWFGLPIMIMGACVLSWTGIMLGLSGLDILGMSTGLLLLLIGVGMIGLGWWHYRHETAEHLRKVNEFQVRWHPGDLSGCQTTNKDEDKAQNSAQHTKRQKAQSKSGKIAEEA